MAVNHSPADGVTSVDSADPPPPAAGGPLTPEAAESEIWLRLIERVNKGSDEADGDGDDPLVTLQLVLAYCSGGYWFEGITEYDAAEFLGVEHRSMQKWRQTGGGPIFSRYSSRCLRYRRIDLKHWQDARMRSSTSDYPPVTETR